MSKKAVKSEENKTSKKSNKKNAAEENKTEEVKEKKTNKKEKVVSSEETKISADDDNDTDVIGRLYRYSKIEEFKIKNKEVLRSLFDHIVTDSKNELTADQKTVLETCGYNDILYKIVTNSTGRKSKMLDFLEANNKFLYAMIKFNMCMML